MGIFESVVSTLVGTGGSKSKTKAQRVDMWNPQQQELFKSLMGTVNSQGMGPASKAPQMYTPRTQEDQNYFDLMKSESIRKMMSGEVPYEIGPEYAEKYFEEGLRPIYEYEWANSINPAIQEQYAGSTFYSTGRDAAVTKAANEYGMQVAKEKAELIYGEEKAKREAIERAQGRMIEGAKLSEEAAKYSREIETEKVMDSVQRFLMGEEFDGEYNPAYNPMVTLAFNLLGLQPYGYSNQTKSSSEGQGMITGFLAGAGGGFGKAAGVGLFKGA